MLSWRAPLCGVDPPQGVGNYRAAPDVAVQGCVLSRRTNTGGERGELLSPVRYSDADRDPAGSYGGGVPLSVLLAGLAKSRVQPVLVYFQVQGALGNPELLGNPRQVALASRDRCADGVALDGVKIRNGRRLREDVGSVSSTGAQEGQLLRKLCCRNGVPVSQHDHAFDHVAHFAYVSRPGVSLERVDHVRLEGLHGYAVAMRHLPVEMLDQFGDVLLALAQRGDAEGGDGYTVEQVLAKTTGRDLRPKIPVGCGDQLELNVARLARPDRIQFSAFEDTKEIWLQFERHLADLVEKQCPATCGLDLADHSRTLGARERAVDIAEELAGQDIARQPTAIHGHERPLRTLPVLVDRAREDLLADS